jgi:exosortase/archaeosortase family protein
MNKQYKEILKIFSRYFFIFLVGIGNLYLFYKIFTPLTINIFYLILGFFEETNLNGNIIRFGRNVIEIVPACVAGAAYYLLFILGMTIRVDVRTRVKAILTALGAFFILNISRLLVLAFLIENPSFELIHWIFWHIVSTLFVIGIWLGTVKFYKIKSIPLYSDLKYIKKLSKGKYSKRKKKHN